MTDQAFGDTNELVVRFYDELRQLARNALANQTPGTLQATALVNEAYLRLNAPRDQSPWLNRSHFMGAAVRAIREVIIDHARAKHALKRGGGLERRPLDLHEPTAPVTSEDVLAIHQALESLAQHDPCCAQLIELTYFGGLTVRESAELACVSERTAGRLIRFGKAWLKRQIAEESSK